MATPTPTPTLTPTNTLTPTPTTTLLPQIIQSGLTINVNGTSGSYPGTGTTWYDLMGNYNADLINGPTWVPGSPNGYFSFDGINDYSLFGSGSQGLDTGSRTFGGWIKSSLNNTQEVFFIRGEDGFPYSNDAYGWSLSLWKDNENAFISSMVFVNGTATNYVYTGGVFEINKWFYVMVRWDVSTQYLAIFVNGIFQRQSPTVNRTTLRNSTKGWQMARYSGPTYSVADIGEFQLYNRALSDAEILQNYNVRLPIYPTPTPTPYSPILTYKIVSTQNLFATELYFNTCRLIVTNGSYTFPAIDYSQFSVGQSPFNKTVGVQSANVTGGTAIEAKFSPCKTDSNRNIGFTITNIKLYRNSILEQTITNGNVYNYPSCFAPPYGGLNISMTINLSTPIAYNDVFIIEYNIA